MANFREKCVKLLSIFIGLAILLILYKSVVVVDLSKNNPFLVKLTVLMIVIVGLGIFTIKSSFSKKVKIIILLLITLLSRVWWILNVNSIPVSDFNTMYLSAKELLSGNLSPFRNYGYLSRFPHLVCMTLYMALMIKIFPISHLIVMKIINIILSVLTVFLLYKLSKNFIENEKTRFGIMLLSAIFPPFITYSSTYCTENIAIPLYLITMILFFKAIKSKIWLKWIICGISLGISELFRGVAIVFLIAFLLYILIFVNDNKLKKSSGLLIGMLGTLIFASIFLSSFNIIDKPLWKGTEPSFVTLLLKGTNIENGGRWNFEDASFVEENLGKPNFIKKCIDISISRIYELSSLERVQFFLGKFLTQWSVGDFSGTYWATMGTNLEIGGEVPTIFQIIFFIIIFFSLVSLLFKISKNKSIIIYILLCGFIILFMIIETQSRYSYIISWTFLILATEGIENSVEVMKKRFIKI